MNIFKKHYPSKKPEQRELGNRELGNRELGNRGPNAVLSEAPTAPLNPCVWISTCLSPREPYSCRCSGTIQTWFKTFPNFFNPASARSPQPTAPAYVKKTTFFASTALFFLNNTEIKKNNRAIFEKSPR